MILPTFRGEVDQQSVQLRTADRIVEASRPFNKPQVRSSQKWATRPVYHSECVWRVRQTHRLTLWRHFLPSLFTPPYHFLFLGVSSQRDNGQTCAVVVGRWELEWVQQLMISKPISFQSRLRQGLRTKFPESLNLPQIWNGLSQFQHE